MPNPADNFVEVDQNYYRNPDGVAPSQLVKLLEFILDRRVHDAIIKTVDTSQADKYTIDLYESGFGLVATKLGLTAYVLDNTEEYDVGYPCKVVLKDNNAYIITGDYQWFFKPKTPVSTTDVNKLEGFPCTIAGVTVATTSIFLNWTFPYAYGTWTNPSTTQTVWTWKRYPKPLQCTGFKAAGVIHYSVMGVPAGTGKYKVLQILDDNSPAGTIGWDYERFS